MHMTQMKSSRWQGHVQLVCLVAFFFIGNYLARCISLGILAVLISPVGQSAFAISVYNSGYAHGSSDAHKADSSQCLCADE